ncbi:dual specificity protein phosphatase 3 isoform X1 [Parasteatoda tepidariorum]|nr:dual specificity protein phosphatase 3 isoform X2 [Parasteatoda tepidariorum]XP_042910031.1 dual specificity protein phosphatase 3 isoform X2 [Parasteatoda tepidariorum]XP_042910032.1 dual specificity protein phosphatase 3 isoform X2 [Parasteatoda tepidariorum]
MAAPSPLQPLKDVMQVFHDVHPPTRSLIGHTWIPRFIETPHVELTKALLCGVDCDEVYPGIFVGDEGTARKKDFLAAVGITHVLNTAEGNGFGQVLTGADFYADCKIKYLGYNLIDATRTRIIDHFEEGVNFIEDGVKNGKVLVHCLMGMSRSVSFVAAYLILKKNMTAKEALTTIRKRREVRPNDGFLVQLLQLEAKGLEKK